MSAVMLSQLGRAAISLAPPWSNRMFKLGLLGNPKGVVPEQLRRYIPSKGTVPVAALKVMAARGAVSGGNARTRARYAKGNRPARTLSQILGG